MDTTDLFERKNDIPRQEEARAIASQVTRWMSRQNSDRPLGDLFQHLTLANNKGQIPAYVRKASAMAVKDAPDLYIGFADTTGHSKAFLTKGKIDGRDVYIVIMGIRGDLSGATDVIFSIDHSEFIHELTHYVDRRRAPGIPEKRHNNASDYFNSAIEFNAYFQQGLNDVLTLYDRRQMAPRSFNRFLNETKGMFNLEWQHALTPANKQRFLKRLYSIWKELLGRYDANKEDS